ncbi:hypothetical protein B0H21DRAFT_821173 [Amylocystis lapponica]|nr:hypothetical protein B0H21DRAFT_821173 [Amylocystis lapponica]
MSVYDVTWSLGSILIGSMVAIFLSGTVTMQLFFYFTVYTRDPMKIRFIVLGVWFLDFLHTVFICVANYEYFIANWGNNAIHDYIPWALAVSIALTATVTFIVQCFFAYRVYTVSRQNLYITVPIATLATARIAFGVLTTIELIRLHSFSHYHERFGWTFITGLAMSSALDVLVTSSLCYYLRKSRTGFASMDAIIHILTFYTVQNGLLTCLVTISALICWVTLSNLVPFGIHLIITKLYANAALATLNARRSLHAHQTTIENRPSGRRASALSSDEEEPRSRASTRGANPVHVQSQRSTKTFVGPEMGQVDTACEDNSLV